MARRSKEELLAEFNRLYNVFDVSVRIKRERMPDIFKPELIPTREEMLDLTKTDKNVTLSQIISGTREAITDDFEMFQFGSGRQSSEEAEFSQYFLKRYSEITGRNYFSDAGRADSVAKKINKRGSIRSDEEFRLLNIFVCHLDQDSLSETEVATANTIMEKYEETLRK